MSDPATPKPEEAGENPQAGAEPGEATAAKKDQASDKDGGAQANGAGAGPPDTKAQKRADDYLKQFDIWLVWLIIVALGGSMIYGASAGTCPAPSGLVQKAVAAPAPAAPTNEIAPAATNTTGADPASPSSETGNTIAAAVGNTAGDATSNAGAAASNVAAPAAPGSGAPGTAGLVRETAPAPPPFTCDDGQGLLSGLLGALLALFIGFAALALGAFTGFLFGLPRTLTGERPPNRAASNDTQNEDGSVSQQTTQSPQVEGSGGQFGSDVNTNLERVSNWLTTIIVGVGLTKLETLPDSFGRLGDFIQGYFGYGGKPFGIAATLFFLVAGFFLIYVGTRVKLSLVFLQSQVDNFRSVKSAIAPEVVNVARAAPAQPSAHNGAPATPADAAIGRADEILLGKSLGDLKSDEEIIAWANAKARAGDPQSALTAYKDVLKRAPLTEQLSRNFALILAQTGDDAGAQNVVGALSATANLSHPEEAVARQQVSTVGLQTRLREGLYRYAQKGYEDSIVAGEELLQVDEQESVSMNHVWLACAYGQKHMATEASPGASAAKRQQLDVLTAAARKHVVRALELDPGRKALLRSLYDRSRQIGADNDLQSLGPALDDLLIDNEPTPA